MKKSFAILMVLFVAFSCKSQPAAIKDQYRKIERMIPMRDGVKLFTAIYIPVSTTEDVPFLIVRTPYSCSPYGETNYPGKLGPSPLFANEKYIHVIQDVRGRYMSEGRFEEMTPAIKNKKSPSQTDESSDCFDTIDWLLKNIEDNNGRAGIYGISYPGFYASASLFQAHPALKAVSPQAPVTDEFEGDDAYHRGAFFLMDNFSFLNSFDHPRDTPWKKYPQIFQENISDAYPFYLNLGPLKNANEKYFRNKSKIWNEYLEHDTKDSYWQARDIRPSLINVKPAVLVVGGWYDAEDLFGALQTYQAIKKQNANAAVSLVMGPWIHGGWSRTDGSKFGTLNFGGNTSLAFQQREFDFFNYYLKDKKGYASKGAVIFETGTNQWKEYDTWPPANSTIQTLYLNNDRTLSFTKPKASKGSHEYVSDPFDPVPYINTKGGGRNNEYMAADQTFASERKDVLVYKSAALDNSVTVTGNITANLFVSTTGTDADFVVKIIDVLPADATDNNGKNIGGMQRLVRAEILRGKFRNSFIQPAPFIPGKVTKVNFSLNDVAHTFLKGHKIMVQIQSSWFPLVDRNPQKFMKIPLAQEADFKKESIRIYHSARYPSGIILMTGK